jgi:hypothetical protein
VAVFANSVVFYTPKRILLVFSLTVIINLPEPVPATESAA